MSNYKKAFNFQNGVQVDDDNFVVTQGGLVGIGTSVPSKVLDVRGNADISGILTTSGMNVGAAISVGSNIIIDAASGIITATKFVGSAGNLSGIVAISTDGFITQAGSLSTTAKVGITTDNPVFDLQIGLNPRTSIGVGITNGDVLISGVTTTGNLVVSGLTTTKDLFASGVSTFIGSIDANIATISDTLKVGTAITAHAGIITATKFVGETNELVNVKTYGAIGDGTTDDRAAIQSAINSAKTVFFPAGTYRVGAALTVWDSYTALIGHESLPTIKVVGTGYSGPVVSVQSAGDNINEFSRIENIKFLFDKDGGGPATYSSTPNETNCGVSINGSLAPTASATNRVLRFKMENCRALGFSNAINLKETTNTLLRRVIIEHNTNESSTTLSASNIYCGVNFDCTPGQVGGISPQASVELHQVIVNVNGAPTNTTSMGFRVTGQDPRDIFFEGCETSGGNYGWFIDPSSSDYNIDIHINRPIIDAVDNIGIYVKDWNGYGALTINGGYVVKDANNSGAGIWVENSRGVNVTGGIQVLGISTNNVTNDEGIRIKDSKICSVTSSTIMNCRYGVSLEDSSNCSVTGNIVGAEPGAFIGGTNPVLSDAVRIFGNSDANTITGNTIKGASASYKYSNGILINASTCEENMVSSNVIDDSTVTNRLSDAGTRTNIFDRGKIGVSTTSGGKLLVGGGTGSAIEFNDSSTRLEIPAANTLAAFTSNIERISINADGDVVVATGATVGFRTSTFFSNHARASFGNNGDLNIYHDGVNSYIQDAGAGQLRFFSDDFVFKNTAGDENIARFIQDGSVELYHNNVLKLESIGAGASVYGQLNVASLNGGTSGLSPHFGSLRYGNESGAAPYSTRRSLDLINTDSGNINYYINANNLANTGDFHWHKGFSNAQLMTLTGIGGSLGIGVTQPILPLHVGGAATVTGNLFVGANLTVGNDLTLTGTVSAPNASFTVNSLSANQVTGNLVGNVNAASGFSTVTNLEVTGISTFESLSNLGAGITIAGGGQNAVVIEPTIDAMIINDIGQIGIRTDAAGIATDVMINASEVTATFGVVGVGTTRPDAAIDFRYAGTPNFTIPATAAYLENRRYMYPPKLTTAERNNLVGLTNGAMIYNSSGDQLQIYINGWVGIGTIAKVDS